MGKVLLIVSLFFVISVFSQPKCELNPTVELAFHECLVRIEPDSIQNYMQALEDFGTRYFLDENRKEVVEWLSKKFVSYGYQSINVDSFYFDNTQYPDSWQYNVVCKSSDFNEWEPHVIIGAHYDAVKNSPGADDNASGTAGVIELARVLNDYGNKLIYPVKYILFAAEEKGLIGSSYSAHESQLKNEAIKLMINMDMISNSSNDSLKVYYSYLNQKVSFLSTVLKDFSSYTGLVPERYNSAASDHATYLRLGYNVAYFHEKEFSPFYHQPEDIVANTNPVYASNIVKAVASTVFGFNHLVSLTNNDYYWWENGTKLTLTWETEKPVDKFVIHQKAEGSYTEVGTTNEHQYTFESLNKDSTHYFVIVSNSQNNKYASRTIEVDFDMLPPKPENFTAYGFETTIELKWEADYKGIIKGYNVYEFDDDEVTKINEASITDTVFTVNIENDKFHYFYVTAVNNDGVESEKSELVSAKLGEHVHLMDSIELLLVLDMSSCNVQEKNILQYLDFLNQDYETYVEVVRGTDEISEELLFNAENIIWISSGRLFSKSCFVKNRETIFKYLEKGGNLLLSVYNVNFVTALYQRDLPSVLPEKSDAYTYLKAQEVNFIENSWFSGAKAEKAGYPDLNIDINQIPENYLTQNYLNAIQSIKPTPDAELIYSYVSPVPNDVNHGNMHRMPLGYEYMGDDYKLVFLSFPLSFMAQDDTKALVEHVLHHRFEIGTQVPEKTEATANPQLSVWPVPANNRLNISTHGLSGTVAVYNNLGTKVLEKVVDSELYLNTSTWPPGAYYLTFLGGVYKQTHKIVIMH